jgi:hypothetical protein
MLLKFNTEKRARSNRNYFNETFKISLLIFFSAITNLKATSDTDTVDLTKNISHSRSVVNVTTLINKSAKLPCFIEVGRKFIWMQANRDEILSIDTNLITSDKRFGIEQSQSCSSSNSNLINFQMSLKKNLTNQNNGCWVYLVINSVSLFDEGQYLCQIDTMSSTLVSLNILGI